jgi:hypothetical protein
MLQQEVERAVQAVKASTHFETKIGEETLSHEAQLQAWAAGDHCIVCAMSDGWMYILRQDEGSKQWFRHWQDRFASKCSPGGVRQIAMHGKYLVAYLDAAGLIHVCQWSRDDQAWHRLGYRKLVCDRWGTTPCVQDVILSWKTYEEFPYYSLLITGCDARAQKVVWEFRRHHTLLSSFLPCCTPRWYAVQLL